MSSFADKMNEIIDDPEIDPHAKMERLAYLVVDEVKNKPHPNAPKLVQFKILFGFCLDQMSMSGYNLSREVKEEATEIVMDMLFTKRDDDVTLL